ncbi:EID1-like F-box protein 3 [Iris pallida]|uniref:EID1-like F-box protein 3 n=1 Tax=Iris pallida TaxID=29817 RepID=A0AAX6HGH4_IRIPA|nr:EID1-like F-box protein 3 [Iris pallida]
MEPSSSNGKISSSNNNQMSNKRQQQQQQQSSGSDSNTGFEDERILLLVFRSVAFDPRVVSVAACVSRRIRAVARRVLWRELCVSRAPRMTSELALGAGGGVGGGGFHALAKLLLFCCGSGPGRGGIPGHLAPATRFSKTSGRSFLHRRCRGDLLYVSDPCEHEARGREADFDVGVYRGIFRGFMRSRTRASLVGRRAELESGRLRCPYCGARVWSMSAARLVPRSASRRLGSHGGKQLDYFVCVNGHLHGNCWLAHLSDDSSDCDDEKEEEEDVDSVCSMI